MRPALPWLLLAVAALAAGPHLLDLAPGCGFRAVTGLLCPGCGSTRALVHLSRGEPGAAIAMNPLLVLGVPLALAAWVAARRSGSPAMRTAFAVGALVAVLAFWVVRNLP